MAGQPSVVDLLRRIGRFRRHKPIIAARAAGAIDDVLDRSVFLGYTKLGSQIRRLWWRPVSLRQAATAPGLRYVTRLTSMVSSMK